VFFFIHCIYRFHIILRASSDYLLKQHCPTDLCNGHGFCILSVTD
jgi:hypothetical protein